MGLPWVMLVYLSCPQVKGCCVVAGHRIPFLWVWPHYQSPSRHGMTKVRLLTPTGGATEGACFVTTWEVHTCSGRYQTSTANMGNTGYRGVACMSSCYHMHMLFTSNLQAVNLAATPSKP